MRPISWPYTVFVALIIAIAACFMGVRELVRPWSVLLFVFLGIAAIWGMIFNHLIPVVLGVILLSVISLALMAGGTALQWQMHQRLLAEHQAKQTSS